MTRAEWLLLALVLAGATAIVRDIVSAPPEPAAPAAAAPVDAGPLPPALAPPPPAPPPTVAPAKFEPAAKYCSETGEESFTITHTLSSFVEEHGGDERFDELRDLALRALSARRSGDVARYRQAMRDAYAKAPAEPAIAWATADAFRHSPEPALAAEAIRRYLAAAGPLPALSRLEARLEVEAEIVHAYARLELGELTLQYPPDEVSPDDAMALLRRAADVVDEAARALASPRRAPLTIVLTPGREEILAVTCVRAWAEAVYDGKLRIARDKTRTNLVGDGVLRHEALHAVMAEAARDAPFWFNEGVAQWFAREHERVLKPWRLVRDNGTYIPFASLDGTFQAFEAKEDVTLAYAQSLFMVHWLLDAAGPAALPRAAAMFRDGSNTSQVLAALVGPQAAGESLVKFLRTRGEPITWPR